MFPFFGSPLGPIAVFVAFTALFHVFLIYVPYTALSRRIWRRIDYVWLCITFFSIVGWTSESRQNLAMDLLPQAREELEWQKNFVRENFEIARRLSCTPFRAGNRHAQVHADMVGAQYRDYCTWMTESESTFIQASSQDREFSFAYENNFPLVANVDYEVAFLRWQIEEYHVMLGHAKELAASSVKSITEKNFTLLSPMLLAIALALRITKVTADLRAG